LVNQKGAKGASGNYHRLFMRERIWIEDALKHVHEWEYRRNDPTPESLAGATGLSLDRATELLDKLTSAHLIKRESGSYRLTREGRKYARHVIRAHRLYETHLAEETGLNARLWHRRAERAEHRMSEDDMTDLAERLGDPRYDPHGDPIPTAGGDLPPPRGSPLVDHGAGWEGRIVHIEDEPGVVYEELIKRGLAPGMRIRVEGEDEAGFHLNAEGRAMTLTRPMATSIMASGLEATEGLDDRVKRLSELRRGEEASVVGLTAACRGMERRRLLDLGLVPGTVVERDMAAPSGNPVAYVIRGASIALRQRQTDFVMVRPVEGSTS
jgi:DtxR family Mn-dependent transcriptional regulator